MNQIQNISSYETPEMVINIEMKYTLERTATDDALLAETT